MIHLGIHKLSLTATQKAAANSAILLSFPAERQRMLILALSSGVVFASMSLENRWLSCDVACYAFQPLLMACGWGEKFDSWRIIEATRRRRRRRFVCLINLFWYDSFRPNGNPFSCNYLVCNSCHSMELWQQKENEGRIYLARLFWLLKRKHPKPHAVVWLLIYSLFLSMRISLFFFPAKWLNFPFGSHSKTESAEFIF